MEERSGRSAAGLASAGKKYAQKRRDRFGMTESMGKNMQNAE
jgi:hypothetical protein